MSQTASLIEPQSLTPLPRSTPRWRKLASILGNPLTMYSEEFFELDIIRAPLKKRTYAQVMKPEYVQQVLQGDGNQFGRSIFLQRLLRPALRDGLLTSEGESWRRQRRAASPAFRQKALDSLAPKFDRAGADLADRLLSAHGNIIDVSPEMIRATFDVIVTTLLARDGNDYPQDEIAKDISKFLTTIGRITIPDLLPMLENLAPRRFFIRDYKKGMAAIQRLRALSQAIIADRMAMPSEQTDLTGLLIASEDPESGARLSAEELVDNVLTFVGAGHETTALTLTWAMYVLAQVPHIQEHLAEEAYAVAGDSEITATMIPQLALHERVIKEVLRLFPPVPIIGRSVLKPIEIGGQAFKPGDHIALAIYPMHRHNSLWESPNAFDPDRFLPEAEQSRHRYQYIPFGGGQRVCIGMRFAMMESISMLASMMRKVRVSLPLGTVPDPHLTITMRPRHGMKLKIEAR